MRNNGFMVRKSGVKESDFYIDFDGEYIVDDIKRITGIENIVKIYKEHKAEYDESRNVFYFKSEEEAEEAINDLVKLLKKSDHVRKVELTESEIEYIRRALINEDSNVIFTKNKIRESIFDKLNR